MSFADYLNKAKLNTASTIATESRAMTLPMDEPAVMTLEEPAVSEVYNGLAYSGLTRSEKYRSKLRISRSFIPIFATGNK